MILVELFFTRDLVPETEEEKLAHKEEQRVLGRAKAYMREAAHKAVNKAIKEQPTIRKLLFLNLPIIRRYYSVKNRWPGSREYIVLLMQDRDGRWWIDCSCPAGNPHASENTGVIAWQPRPCYHMGSVLLNTSKTANALAAKEEKRRARSATNAGQGRPNR